MKYRIHWSNPYPDGVDLTDYGYDHKKTWEELSDSQRDEILDSLREQQILCLDRVIIDQD